MRDNDQLDLYYEQIKDTFHEQEQKNSFAKYFLDICEGGYKKFYQKNITETKQFDEEWIRTMESFFPSIDRIIRNPKLTIRYDEDVVAIEKAKKITSTSIRHLASHTQLIREIKGDEITPKKILTTFAEEEIVTYENRFIMTLIDRLHTFVNNRYQVIKENVESFQKDHLNYTSDLEIKNSHVSVTLDVVIKKDLENPSINKHNFEILARVEKLVTLIGGYKSSPFMKQMGKARKVSPPIMKTNVILKNADFRNAYMLWLFLDRYNSLTFDVAIRERPVHLSGEFSHNLNRISSLSYAMLLNNLKNRAEDFLELDDAPRIIKRSTKIAKIHPHDVIKNPDAIVMVDNTINEYYLDQNRKTLNKTIKEYLGQDMTEPAALKRAIKDTINISNALFQTVFYLEESEDYFKKMTVESNPKKDFAEAKYKLRLAKIIREAKEVDYRQAIKLEKKLLSQMEVANNTMMKNEIKLQKRSDYEKVKKQVEKELKVKEKDKIRLKSEITKLEGKMIDTSTNKTILQQEQELVKIRIDENKKKIKQEEQQRIKIEIKALKKAHQEKMAKYAEEEKAQLLMAKQKYEERQRLNKERIKDAINKAKEEEKVKNKLLLEREKVRLKALEEKEKERLKKLSEKEKDKLKELEQTEKKQLSEITNGTFVEIPKVKKATSKKVAKPKVIKTDVSKEEELTTEPIINMPVADITEPSLNVNEKPEITIDIPNETKDKTPKITPKPNKRVVRGEIEG